MTSNQSSESLNQTFQHIRDTGGSLNEQLQALTESSRQRRPEFAEAVERLMDRLRRNGAGEAAPKVGEIMPPFYLPDEAGHIVSLEGLLTQGPVAVTFHRGHWCPYCRISINALARAHPQIAADGRQVVAIIPDRQMFAAKMKETSNVPFPILTDMDNGYALSLNLAIWVGAEVQKIMSERQNLPEYQGNDSWLLPIPATFVVGQDGRIKARFVDPDYRRRMAIEDLVAALHS